MPTKCNDEPTCYIMGPNGIRQRKPAVIMTPEEAYAMIVENVGGDGYSKSRLNMMRNILRED